MPLGGTFIFSILKALQTVKPDQGYGRAYE